MGPMHDVEMKGLLKLAEGDSMVANRPGHGRSAVRIPITYKNALGSRALIFSDLFSQISFATIVKFYNATIVKFYNAAMVKFYNAAMVKFYNAAMVKFCNAAIE
jgi:hypothetical protein